MTYFCMRPLIIRRAYLGEVRDKTQLQIRDDINEIVRETMKIDYNIFYTGPKTRYNTAARHIAWYFTKRNTRLSLKEIGGPFSKDHSTVLCATDPRRYTALTVKKDYDRELNDWFRQCQKELNRNGYAS